MSGTNQGRDQKLFLVASFLWLLSYIMMCLIVVDPWHLTILHMYNDLLMWVMAAVACFAMLVALWWGVKELQRSGSNTGNTIQYPTEVAKPATGNRSTYLSIF